MQNSKRSDILLSLIFKVVLYLVLSHSVYWKTIHLYTIHRKKFDTAEDKSTTQRNDAYFIADLKGLIKFGDRPIQKVVKIFFNCLFP